MKQTEINENVTYHNGKVGPRSYSERKVIEMNVQYSEPFTGITFYDGVRYIQTAGKYKGETSTLSIKSFAQWAKGVVGGTEDE